MNKAGFLDAFFADDLNCYKVYHKTCQNKVVYEELAGCQKELHKWGAANRVQFDATKEHLHVLDRHTPEGEGFELLGVDFDEKLTMQKEVDELANRCHWKLRTLLRSKTVFHYTTACTAVQKPRAAFPGTLYPSAVPRYRHTTANTGQGAEDLLAQSGAYRGRSSEELQLGKAKHEKRRGHAGSSAPHCSW